MSAVRVARETRTSLRVQRERRTPAAAHAKRCLEPLAGYLVCEEVWVEREVERELPAAAPPKPRPAAFAAPKPALVPKPPAKGKSKEPRGLVTEDAEEPTKKPKGKTKAAPDKKVVMGAGSICSFFGKK